MTDFKEYDPNSEQGKRIKEFTDFLDKAWYDVDGVGHLTEVVPTVDVWMGDMGSDDNKWYAESYNIGGGIVNYSTGRAGFLLFYKNVNKCMFGFPIKYSIFKQPVSREEFIATMKLGVEIAEIDSEIQADLMRLRTELLKKQGDT